MDYCHEIGCLCFEIFNRSDKIDPMFHFSKTGCFCLVNMNIPDKHEKIRCLCLVNMNIPYVCDTQYSNSQT